MGAPLAPLFPFFLACLLISCTLTLPAPQVGAATAPPSEAGNPFTLSPYSGHGQFTLNVDPGHLPPQFAYYITIFPSDLTTLKILEGDRAKMNDTFKTFQGGSIDQIPVGAAGPYTIILDGSGRFVVFLLPETWLNRGELSLETLGNWTTIGIVSQMWGETASSVHLSISSSTALRMYAAEVTGALEIVRVAEINTATQVDLFPGSLTMFYLIFLEDRAGGPAASAHLTMGSSPPGPPLGLILGLVIMAAAVVAIATLVLRWISRRSA